MAMDVEMWPFDVFELNEVESVFFLQPIKCIHFL